MRRLVCLKCDRCLTPFDAEAEGRDYPPSPCCGDRSSFDPAGTSIRVDCHPPRFSVASGQFHTSRHELERHMASRGWEAAGDPVGGARPDGQIRDTAFSYPGQPSRRSMGEFAKARQERLRNKPLTG